HVVWTDTRSPILGPDIFYANSTDGGLSFNPSIRVNDDVTSTEQGQPAIAVASNRDVYVVWRDPRSAAKGPDIYFSKSSDLGATWSPNIYLNSDVGNAAQQDPTIAVDLAGTIYVAWTDGRNANTAPDIYETWSANMKVNDDSLPNNFQMNPSVAVDAAGDVFAAFLDTRTIGWDVYAATLDVVAPTANAGSAVTVDQGANVAFDGSGSSDNFG